MSSETGIQVIYEGKYKLFIKEEYYPPIDCF